MKHFIHYKKNNTSFDIVHLSGPRSNYNITENGGTLFYNGKDTKNVYDITDVEKFYWSRGETLKSTWAIEYANFAIKNGDVFKDGTCIATYFFDSPTNLSFTNVKKIVLSDFVEPMNYKYLDWYFYTGNTNNTEILQSEYIQTGTSDNSKNRFSSYADAYQNNRTASAVTITFKNIIPIIQNFGFQSSPYIGNNGTSSFKLTAYDANDNIVGTKTFTNLFSNTAYSNMIRFGFIERYTAGCNAAITLQAYDTVIDQSSIYTEDPKLSNSTLVYVDGSKTKSVDKIIEQTGKVITNNGVTNTINSLYFNNTSSISFPASTSYAFGTGNFTIELMVNIKSYPVNQYNYTLLLTNRLSVAGLAGTWGVNINGGSTSGRLSFSEIVVGPTQVLYSNTRLSLNTWYHISLVRNNGKLSLYINGVLDTTVDHTINYSNATQPLLVGTSTDANGYFNGYMKDIRVTKGVALYTSDFTIPTTLTKDTNTSLLLQAVTQDVPSAIDQTGRTLSGDTNLVSISSPNNPNTIGLLTAANTITTPVTNNLIFGSNDFTIDFWAKTTGSFGGVVCAVGTSGADTCYRVSLGSNTILFSYGNGGWGWAQHISATYTFTANTWYYIMVRRKNGVLEYYVNHQKIFSQTFTTALRATGTLFMGSYFGSGEILNGYVDQFRISNTALNPHTFFHGTPSNIAYVDGKYNQAISFNGVNSKVALPANMINDFPFSFSAWVKAYNPNEYKTTDSADQIFSLSLPGRGGSRFTIAYTGWSDRVNPLMITTGGNSHYKTSIPNTGEWTHITVIATAVNNYTVFVNGIKVNVINQGGAHGGSGTNCIGSNGVGSEFFYGAIDHVKIFNRALTDSEAQTLYTSTN